MTVREAIAARRDPPSTWSRRPVQLVQPRTLVMGVTVLLIAYLVITPLGFLFYRTFVEDGALTLDGFARAYQSPAAVETMVSTVVYALGSGLLAIAIGTALAYVNVRTDVPFSGLFFAAALVPLIIPAVLYAPAWVFLASPRIGVFNAASSALFGVSVVNVYSLPGMILVEGLHLSPIAFLLMIPAFRAMDPSLEESGRVSGASRREVVQRVTLPLVRPALASAGLLVTIQALESFEVPALLGFPAGIYTFTTRIYFLLQQFPIDYAAAGALGVSLLLLATAGISLNHWLNRGLARYGTVSGKAFRPRPVPLGQSRPIVGGLVFLYFAIAVIAPMAMLLYSSLLPFYEPPSLAAFGKLSFANYTTLFSLPAATRALWHSVLLGLLAATAVMLLTSLAAWFVVRTRARFRVALDNLAFAPLVVPGLVMGLALLFVYIRVPLPIYGTLVILFIGYVTRSLPYGMRYSVAAMHQVSAELEESAWVSGASWGQAFRRILIPLTSAGFIAGWTYIFLVSFRELSTSILLYSPGREVLSILVFEEYQKGELTVLSALGVVMITILLTVVGVAYKLGARFGLQEES